MFHLHVTRLPQSGRQRVTLAAYGPRMTIFTRWMASLGSSGAAENAARECRHRRELEAALDERLEALEPSRRPAQAA